MEGRVNKPARAPLRSTILASATAAATLPSQTNHNNNSSKHSAIVRITRTSSEPEPMMESLHFLNNRTSTEPEEQGLPSFQSFVSRNSPSPAQWQPDMMSASPLSRYDFMRLQNQVQLLRSNSELQEQESKFAISPMPTTALQRVLWSIVLASGYILLPVWSELLHPLN